jgi:sigma-B regulation protein RsbU (phosphoserine phosphatase)
MQVVMRITTNETFQKMTLSKNKFQIHNIPSIIFDFLFRTIARFTSYIFAVSIFSAGIAGIVASFFTLYYFDAVNLTVSHQFMEILKNLIIFYWIIIAIQNGLLYKLKVPGFFKHIKNINRMITTYPDISIKQDLPDTDYKILSRSLMYYPLFNALNLVGWIGTAFVVVLGVSIYTEGINKSVIISICVIVFIIVFLAFTFAYVLSESLTGKMREKCKEIMAKKKIPYVDRATATVRMKMFFFLLLFTVNLFLSNVLTYFNRNDLEQIINFFVISILVSILLANTIFKLIYDSLKQIEFASHDLIRGGLGLIHSRSLDKEFINVTLGINNASKKLLEYQQHLEEKVQSRTKDLNIAMERIRDKEFIMETELDFAADIQKGIIPTNLSPWNGINFAAYYQPMGKVSGDYYDIFRLSGHVFVLLADVSGHGVPAALITMLAKQAFSNVVHESLNPDEIFRQVNEIIVNRVETSDYLTCFLLKIDQRNRVIFGSGGHPNAIKYAYKKGTCELLDTNGMFIGSMLEANEFYENGTTKLSSGDRIILYTDGVIEHKNVAGEQFGLDRLLELVKLHKTVSLKETVESISENLKDFMRGAPVRDDISIVGIELDPRWSTFANVFNDGVRLMKDRRFEDAQKSLSFARQLIPTFYGLNFQMATLNYHLKNFEIAEKQVIDFLGDKPGDKHGLKLAIRINRKLNKLQEADELLKLLKDVSPRDAKRLSIK